MSKGNKRTKPKDNTSTENEASQEALRQAEEKYRNIFENSLDGIFQSTPEGRFLTVNPALARIWGYESPEDLISNITNIAQQVYVKPEQREEFMQLMDEYGEVEAFEFQVYRKDGSMIWVQENVRTVKDADGNMQYYEGTVKDITEQKQTLEALRRSEERYRRTLNNMLEGCQIIDYDWRYIYVNDTAVLYGRRKPEELLMHTMMEIYPGIENTELFRVLQHCMEARTHRRMENEFVFPDGDRGWFELSIEPVPEGLFILSIDITERKRAESELRDREARYRTLFENLPIPVFTKDREGRYTSFNAEESKYWAESPIGHTDHELLPKEIADDLRADDLHVMETKEPWFGEEIFQSPFGLLYSLSRKVPLYDGDGNVIGILGASLDITERKQAENKLQEAEQFNQATIDALTAHICVLDEDGVILSVNRAWHEFAEANPPVPPGHFIGANYLAVCDAAQGETSAEATPFAAGLRSVMKNERTHFNLEYPCNVPSGEKRWFVARVTRFTIDKATRYVVAHENISKRRMMEEALRASDARFSTAFHASPLATAITRMKDNRLIDVNQTWLELTGVSREGAIGHAALELNIWPSRDERAKLIEELQRQGRVQGFEVHLRKKSGEIADLLFSAELIELSGESHMLSMALDISDRKRADRELLESEKRYRDLVDNSQELICTHDLDGNLLSVNPWASKTLGYPMGELLQNNIVDFILPSHRTEFQRYLAEIKENGRARGLMTVQTSSGRKLIWEYNNSLRTEGVEKPIVRGMAHDVTEQRRAEKKIRQQLARLTAVNEIDRVITSSFDLGLTLNLLLRHVVQQLDLDAALILLADPNTKMLEYVAGEGFLGSEIKGLKLHIGEDYAGKVALERRMIHVPDLSVAEQPFSQPHLTAGENFAAYYGLPLLAKGQLKGVLEVFQRASLDADEDWLSYLETLAEQAAIAIDNAQLFNNLQQTNADLSLSYDATIEGWSYALDLRDKETEGHTQRVTELTTKLGKNFGLDKKELTYARWGALLHDIGKMGIPDAILQKPDKLSDEEWVIMKMHPVYARKMLERINYLKSAIDIPYCHHEKWDGSGYPRGLKGEQIPLPARIFAVVDVWDALTSDRPYRPAWKRKDALDYIKSAAGTHLDPQIVKVFLETKDLWTDENK
jgi:PAS domain S-box-containing protein/putative nucleotidyltransferase with HDIG domain